MGEIAHIKTGGRNNQDKIKDGEYPFFVRSEDVERLVQHAFCNFEMNDYAICG